MAHFSTALRRILANRHSPEATAFFHELLGHIHRRVSWTASRQCSGLLSTSEHEEIIGDVLYHLMEGGLTGFRGESLPELLSYVRTICDRTTWRAARRRLKERQIVERVYAELDPRWQARHPPSPDRLVDWTAESPLSDQDRGYLQKLLRSGSKAALAKQDGVSRAAVTQRIQRIRHRLGQLEASARETHEAWLHQEARRALAQQAPSLEPI
jgi:hypothetical protein